jgi:hypothetical protein
MMVALSSKLFKVHLNAVKYRRYSWFYRSALSTTAKLWSRLSTRQCKMSRGSCLSRLSEPESHPCSSLAGIYHRVCRQLNIYGMNSVDVFAIVKIHRKHHRSCMTHLSTYGTTSDKSLSNDWLFLCVGDAKLSLLQEVVTHVTELRELPCMIIFVCPWFVLIMMLRHFVDITLFVMIISIWIIRFVLSM